MSEAANGASRHHMKDADKLRDRNFLFLLSALRGGGPVLQACLHVWKPTQVSASGDGRLIPMPFLTKTPNLGNRSVRTGW